MVKLPDEFVATKYPGYFFNRDDEQLYSLKVDGILKPLKYHVPNRFNHIGRFSDGGFYVSVKGLRKFYPIEKLRELKPEDSTIPVKEV